MRLENLDFSEQLELFSNAKVAISSDGAVMANYLFMPQDSHVIPIKQCSKYRFYYFIIAIFNRRFKSHEVKPRILESVLESLNEIDNS